MRYALIFNNSVTNIIILSPENLLDLSFQADSVIELPEGSPVGIGWSYLDGNFISPVQEITE